MKLEELKTSKKDIEDIYCDFIRVQKLFTVIMDSIGRSGSAGRDELDALDGATDYLNRVMHGFDEAMTLPRLSQEANA